jgi:hypothetical protein
MVRADLMDDIALGQANFTLGKDIIDLVLEIRLGQVDIKG